MKLLFAIFSVLTLIAGCNLQSADQNSAAKGPLSGPQTDSAAFTDITWQEKTLDFGKIDEGQKLEVVYHFKNTGTKPLIISSVEPGCGCTVAETPTAPIAPGKEGVIKGSFDSNSRPGTQHKSIFVYANTKGTQRHELVFTVEVNKKS